MPVWKRITIAVLLLAVVAGLGYAMYVVFFKSETALPENANLNANTPSGALPQAGGANLNRPVVPGGAPGAGSLIPASPVAVGGYTETTTLVSQASLGAILGPDGKSVRYYDRSTGRFMYVDADGNIRELSDQYFPEIQEVTWSGDGNRAVLSFPDGSKISYDFATGEQATLPSAWEEFSFSPDSKQVAAKSLSASSTGRYLVVSDANGENARPIEALGNNEYNVDVAWSPAGDVVALSSTGEGHGFGMREELFIGQNGENFPSIEVNGLGFEPLWSPDGSLLLYSAAGSDDDFIPRLYTVAGSGDRRGGNQRQINLFTLASKCFFADAATVYCAAPDSPPAGSGLSPEVLDDVPDSIYRINATTGAVTLVGRPVTDTTVSRLSVSSDGATLFYVDKASGTISKMMLK
jgi:WD40 repeat protein